jgi:hypothetical protein
LADDLYTPFFSAVEHFQRLVDDVFCDLDETRDGVTPMAFAQANGKSLHATIPSGAGAHSTLL